MYIWVGGSFFQALQGLTPMGVRFKWLRHTDTTISLGPVVANAHRSGEETVQCVVRFAPEQESLWEGIVWGERGRGVSTINGTRASWLLLPCPHI